MDFTDSRTGKRLRRKVGLTKAQAQNALAKLQAEAFEGRWRDTKGPVRVTFEEFATTEYLPWARANLKSFNRVEHFVQLAVQFFQGLGLDEITPALVEKYKTALTQTKVAGTNRLLAPRTIVYALTSLKGVYTKGITWQKTTSNPVRPVKMPTVNNFKTRFLDSKEVAALLQSCETGPEYLKPLVTTLCNAGLRIGEAMALKWTDVDFPKSLLTVRHGKGNKSRILPMNGAVKDALGSLAVGSADQTGHVFIRRGRPVVNGRRAFQGACRRAGLGRDVTPHTLRHTFASHLASNGVDLLVLRDLLGHSSVQVTVARYAHLFPDRGKKAVDLLDRFWNPANGVERAREGHEGTVEQDTSFPEARRVRTEETSHP